MRTSEIHKAFLLLLSYPLLVVLSQKSKIMIIKKCLTSLKLVRYSKKQFKSILLSLREFCIHLYFALLKLISSQSEVVDLLKSRI